jgi:beta-lactam-binding protein with PASTA domain
LLKQTSGAAETALRSVGLNLGSIGGPPNGVVASQDPLPGTMVDAKSSVNLSLQLETVSVPNVIQDGQSDATHRLAVFHLQPGFSKDTNWDATLAHVVVRQNPEAGTEVAVGSKVEMVLGNVPLPPPPPPQVPRWAWPATVGMLALAGGTVWKWKYSPPKPAAVWTVASSQRSTNPQLRQNADPKLQWTFGLRDRVPARRYRCEREPIIRRRG